MKKIRTIYRLLTASHYIVCTSKADSNTFTVNSAMPVYKVGRARRAIDNMIAADNAVLQTQALITR